MEVQIKDNKIYAPLKDKWLVVKPEEEVRQRYICRLVDSYGYDLKQMDQELKVTNSQRGQGAARADIVIWKSAKDKTDSKSAFIVVECKAESVTIRKEDYYQGYNYAAWAGADFFVTTNLKETRVFKVVKGELPKKLEEIVDIPTAEMATDEKKVKELLTRRKHLPETNSLAYFTSAIISSEITTNYLQKRLLTKLVKFFLLRFAMSVTILALKFSQRMHL